MPKGGRHLVVPCTSSWCRCGRGKPHAACDINICLPREEGKLGENPSRSEADAICKFICIYIRGMNSHVSSSRVCDIQVLEPVEIGLNKHTASFADEVF